MTDSMLEIDKVDLYAGIDKFDRDDDSEQDDGSASIKTETPDPKPSSDEEKSDTEVDEEEEEEDEVHVKVEVKTEVVVVKSELPPPLAELPKNKVKLFIGNLTWWTTDEEINSAILSCGVNDLLDLKFNENRVNGQSKGYALVTVGSIKSYEKIASHVPRIPLHNKIPKVTECNPTTLKAFELAARLDGNTREEKEEETIISIKNEDITGRKNNSMINPVLQNFMSNMQTQMNAGMSSNPLMMQLMMMQMQQQMTQMNQQLAPMGQMNPTGGLTPALFNPLLQPQQGVMQAPMQPQQGVMFNAPMQQQQMLTAQIQQQQQQLQQSKQDQMVTLQLQQLNAQKQRQRYHTKSSGSTSQQLSNDQVNNLLTVINGQDGGRMRYQKSSSRDSYDHRRSSSSSFDARSRIRRRHRSSRSRSRSPGGSSSHRRRLTSRYSDYSPPPHSDSGTPRSSRHSVSSPAAASTSYTYRNRSPDPPSRRRPSSPANSDWSVDSERSKRRHRTTQFDEEEEEEAEEEEEEEGELASSNRDMDDLYDTISEYEMHQKSNKDIVKNAISRALNDSSIGNNSSAVETLRTALMTLQNSKISKDNRTQSYIDTIKETIHNIQLKINRNY